MTVRGGTTSRDTYLALQRRAADAAIGRALADLPESGLGEVVRYAMSGGGKRLRFALSIACYEAVAARTADERVADLACAIELIHTYSLVHDDLPCMDNDDLRRGRPTAHRVHGDRAAALAGAALIPLAFRHADRAAAALGLVASTRIEIARTLARAAGAQGMVGGQVLDLAGASTSPGLAVLEATHAAKTGALLRAACLIGGLAAGATDSQLDALAAYGAHLGLAFQITDDVLDETASSAQLGKTAGKDREHAKPTFPALIGAEAAMARANEELSRALRALEHAHLARDTLAELGRFAVERKQ